MDVSLIGLSGPARCGKDTAAKFIARECKIQPYALAQPIKNCVNMLFNWDERHSDGELKEVDDPELGFSPRKAYQLFGTEFGRNLRDDLWVRLAGIKYRELGGLLVTDVRFENEAEWIRSEGGIIIHVVRDEVIPIRPHASEAGIAIHDRDWLAYNNGSFDDFFKQLLTVIGNENEKRHEEKIKEGKKTFRQTA